MSTDNYASEEETRALLRKDTRTPAERKLDRMLEERGASEQGAEPTLILRQIALELLAEQPAPVQEPICKLFGTLPVYDKPAQQVPVAWVCYGSNNKHDIDFFEDEIADLAVGTKLYTQAQRTWVGLSDEDRAQCVQATHETGKRGNASELMAAIESKLKEKNT